MSVSTSRRGFLKGAAASAAAVLVIGAAPSGVMAATNGFDTTMLNPFVRIASDGTVTAIVKHFEKGQGPATGLTTLIAEELGVSMEAIEYEFAPSNPKLYNNTAFGPFQGTGGSTAMFNSFLQYRQAGAAAREVLLQAASQAWELPVEQLKLEDGVIIGGGETAPLGEFVQAASQLEAPENPRLKDPSEFKLIGNASIHRKDTPPKVNGTAKYAMDIQLDDQMVVAVKRAMRRGALAVSFDDSAALSVKGFIRAAMLPNKAGVVVYADDTWAALQARDAIEVTWDYSAAESRSSEDVYKELMAAVNSEPEYNLTKNDQGTVAAAIENADKVVEETFYFPLLAHAPMEPLTCTIEPTQDGGVVLHDGSQMPTSPHMVLSKVLQLPMEKVQINTMFAGGSFGRRATPTVDYQTEAALAFAMTDRSRPVKLVWSREDDITGGYYRPAFAHKVRVGLDSTGNIVGWDHRVAGQSIAKGTPFEAFAVHDGIDDMSVEGVTPTPYSIPGMFAGLTDTKAATSVLWWRSVGHTHTAYVMETMMDATAAAAGRDPVEFRLAHLSGDVPEQKRMANVLKLAAEKGNWGKAAEGRSQGIAVHSSFRSYVAEVVEISGDAEAGVKIEKVTCAVDCGIPVNPDVIKAQMEGGIGYGLGHAMRDEITLEEGEVVQSNFPDYEPLRIGDIGEIETHIVLSTEAPTGVGEPGTPPSAPALANAIAVKGPRVTELPMVNAGVNFA
ncbi:Isoquinoline 1-oxidoreductase subunit beta [Pseudovibrio axinellae]|uniref:Isoquinoline 1-oxidoreductase subunit beta n=1 Tax=Pseudovibrio axinellae TaxID=989403 RepID=A0A165UNG8_9HYPH|nr:molybdopterin cofactor-binding domain-containing protein [Pseudovibrio axinellae]KZL12607.1 Isoquinoline 1-oxidoreductase subunit beta [Pseudovibrio axinellae]SEP64714.1 isoquinoline 1-oxidoreductase, beta subunit [Pseudovibrio axinellae]